MSDQTRHLFAAVDRRRAVRRYRPDPVPEDILYQLLEAARWAPTGGNAQDHAFGIVTDPARREALAQAAGNQSWVATAPVIIACCVRLYRPEEESESGREVNDLRWGKEMAAWLEACPYPLGRALVLQNAVPLIPGAHLQLAAAAHGLGTCWIGCLDIAGASDILGLPEDWRCYFLIPVGYPAEDAYESSPSSESDPGAQPVGSAAGQAAEKRPSKRPRRPLTDITFAETWERPRPPVAGRPSLSEPVLRPYRHPDDEAEWLDIWGRVAVTSHAWAFIHHGKPRYERESLELVAEAGGEIVGFIDVEIETEPEELGYAKDSPCGFVWEFGVRPDYQGLGIARVMIRAAEEWLTPRGIRRMEFWSADETAQSFYGHLGMREMERHWQFHMLLPKDIRARMKADDKVDVFSAYSSCPIDGLEQIKERYQVRTGGREGPKVCIGFDHRW